MKKARPKVIAVVGQTATGKSALAVLLAKNIPGGGEVVSADSRQVYRGLDLGSGKITKKEMRGVPHHSLDIFSPARTASVSQYAKQAGKAVEKIVRAGKVPVVCGGSGFYLDTLLRGMSLPEVPPQKDLRKKLEKLSLKELGAILNKLDKKRYETIDRQNPVRLIRAIEIATALGKVPERERNAPPYEVLWIGLSQPEEKLRKAIRRRIDARMKKGMRKEAEGLLMLYGPKRVRAWGLEYRLLADLIEGKIGRKEFDSLLETEIYRFAKRQMTWFKKHKDIHWLPASDKSLQKQALKLAENFLAK